MFKKGDEEGLVLNEKDCAKRSNMTEVIDSVAQALQEYSSGRTVTPIRTVLPVTKTNGNALFMPAFQD